ncbi:efflux RND transporter periplasmic adaptor subunit [Endozoicomonas montiporae]|uniref:Membrane fusion protein, multidrug efflux system n=1 Tax=Endozoicomonas montiporae CL-33 TaxID=570277 RepID=A0A142BHV7_9GAMM|nr:efflux RND transporter periplasmic adaptor subunit [Endozoicomonas montiporae]AMO58333.1 membrane fusion protein, multidrug efflux system [Endozoicomonas montiporae CL-33]
MKLLKNSLILLASLSFIPGAFASGGSGQGGNQGSNAGSNARSVVVDVQTVQAHTWQEQLTALGNVYARNQITLTSKVAGSINKINFTDSQTVGAGYPLIEIDSRFEQAKLQEAKAKLLDDERRLNEMQLLEAKKAISQSELQAQEALVEQSRAAVDAAATTLSFYTLKAPFDGVLGLSDLSPGQYVRTGDALVTLTDLEHLYVDLNFPDKYLSQINTGMTVDLQFDAWPNLHFTATISSLDPVVSMESRNFKVRSELNNAEGLLRPGLLTQATLSLTPESVITIPTSSIFYRGPQAFVYRVIDNKAVEQAVNTLQIVGEKTYIRSGLTVGDEIITAGISKVSNGIIVTPSSAMNNHNRQLAQQSVESVENNEVLTQ